MGTIKLNEEQLKKIVAESVMQVLKEVTIGGNDWGDRYGQYKMRNKTNVGLDDAIEAMHTICQYADDIYNVVYEGGKSKYFPQAQPQVLQNVWKNIQPIYGLMANKTNIAGDEQGITVQDIQKLLPYLKALAKCGLSPINTSANRFFNGEITLQ